MEMKVDEGGMNVKRRVREDEWWVWKSVQSEHGGEGEKILRRYSEGISSA